LLLLLLLFAATGNAVTGHYGLEFDDQSAAAAAAAAAALRQELQFAHLRVQLSGNRMTVTAADGSKLSAADAAKVGAYMNGMTGAKSVHHVQIGECQ
jgi:hypothetical protein